MQKVPPSLEFRHQVVLSPYTSPDEPAFDDRVHVTFEKGLLTHLKSKNVIVFTKDDSIYTTILDISEFLTAVHQYIKQNKRPISNSFFSVVRHLVKQDVVTRAWAITHFGNINQGT